MSLFNGPYNMEFTWTEWYDGRFYFICPRCKKEIKKGEKVVAYPWPRCEVWHARCREIYEEEELIERYGP